MRPLTLFFSVISLVCGCLSFGDTTRRSQAVGWRFQSTQDAYVFRLEYNNELFVGRYDLANGAKGLPKIVATKFVGRSIGGMTIVDIIPAGSTFSITGVQESKSELGDIVSFSCQLDGNKFQSRMLNLRFVQSNIDGSGQRDPEIDPAYAHRILPHNQSSDPTPTPVTPPAGHEARHS